jgi:hypothetical protein
VICVTANALWLAGCLPEFMRFRRATARVREEQETLLADLLRRNAGTEFGRLHKFGSIRSVADYQSAVPLSRYEDLEPWIARAANGDSHLLTADRIRLFEPTSGSSGATKLIPTTPTVQREFQRGIRAWVADLFLTHPALMLGQAYWSVSPQLEARRHTPSGIPIGFDDDAAYVGGWQRRLVDAARVRPVARAPGRDLSEFQYQTLLALVRASNLRLISVWHPTYLSAIVDRFDEWAERLKHDAASDSAAVAKVRAACAAATPHERCALLFPQLRVISCWMDGNAAAAAATLGKRFRHVTFQAKGLIATEAFISFPLTRDRGCALAVRSHVFEFLPLADDKAKTKPRLAHELECGRRYEVIVTTSSGLYRYRLGDVIDVVDHLRDCPLIRFIGRRAYVSDWVGEKLNESHVSEALKTSFGQFAMTPSFAMLACDTTLSRPAYVLYVDSTDSDEQLERFTTALDESLQQNVHYAYARRLGQLGPLRVFRAERADETYLAAAVCAGQRAGDVKLLALDRRDGWSRVFRGRFING